MTKINAKTPFNRKVDLSLSIKRLEKERKIFKQMNDKIKETVNKLWSKVKAEPYHWGFCVGVILLLIPILIWLAYLIGRTGFGIPTDFSAGDVLGFYGSFLAFLGTVALGTLALWQNYTLSKKNDDYNVLMHEMERQKNLPTFVIDDGQGYSGCWSNYWLTIKNLSSNPASNMTITNFNIFDAQNVCKSSSTNVKIKPTSLSGGETTRVEFTNDEIRGQNLRIVFRLSYDDKFDVQHNLSATSIISNTDDFAKLKFTILEEDNQYDQPKRTIT